MTVPNTSEFIRMMQRLNAMIPELEKGIKPAKDIIKVLNKDKDLVKNLTNLKDRVKVIEGEARLLKSTTGRINTAIKEQKKAVEAAKKVADNSKSLWDNFLSKVKGGGQAQKAAGAGGSLAAFAAIGGVAIIVALQAKVNEFTQEQQDKVNDRLNTDLTKVNTLAANAAAAVKKINAEIAKINKQRDSLNAEIAGNVQNTTKARETANNALYEARQGRKIVEAKIEAARKFANDALYEARQGRAIVEAKIQAQAVEFRSQVAKMNASVAQTKADIQKVVQANLDKIATSLNGKVEGLNKTSQGQTQSINALKADIREIGSISGLKEKIEDFQQQINKAGYLNREIRDAIYAEIKKLGETASAGDRAALEIFRRELDSRLSKAYVTQDQLQGEISRNLFKDSAALQARIEQLNNTWGNTTNLLRKTFDDVTTQLERKQVAGDQNLQRQIDTIGNKESPVTANKIADLKDKIEQIDKKGNDDFFDIITSINGKIKAIQQARKDDVEFIVTSVDDKIARVQQNINGKLEDVDESVYRRAMATLNPRITNIETGLGEVKEKVKEHEKKLTAIPIEIERLKPEIEKLKQGQKEQDDMNKEGNKKLDSIIPMLAGIPLIPGRVADTLRPSIPTVPQMENAAAVGVCRTTQPGGCMNKALNDNANQVNANTSNKANDILGALNLGGSAQQISMLTDIQNRLGAQIPGGLSGKLQRFSKWLHLDRALNLMILASTIHNASMLSNNLAQTLSSTIGNVLSAIGLKDSEGQAFDIGSVINKGVEAIVKSIIGEENYKTFNTTWKKANRIYQASANLLNSIQSLSSSILNALEVVGQWNAKVANALKRFGVVSEKAYGWMNPNINFQNKYFTALENATNVISQVDQVASEVLSIKETVKQITEQKKELDDSLKQGDSSKQKTDLPEATKVKAQADASKVVSTGSPLAEADKEADD
jgi:predicted  nucleic acid-binding Zn-ribbon protein